MLPKGDAGSSQVKDHRTKVKTSLRETGYVKVCGESAKSPQKMKNLKKQFHRGKCGRTIKRVSLKIRGISGLMLCVMLAKKLWLRKHPIESIRGSKWEKVMTEDHHKLRSLMTGDHHR
jgi:hypothetical protein